MNKNNITESDRLLETLFPGILTICGLIGMTSPCRAFGADNIKVLCLQKLLQQYDAIMSNEEARNKLFPQSTPDEVEEVQIVDGEVT